MVRSGTPEPAGGDQSLGDLVALAAKDVSQLVRHEIDLAKSELRGDLVRGLVAGALFGITAFFGCLILLTLCFAYAYLLHDVAHVELAGAFGFVALTFVLLGVAAVFVAKRLLGGMTGLHKTRESVSEGLGVLRRGKRRGPDRTEIPAGNGAAAGAPDVTTQPGDPALGDAQRTEIPSRTSR